MYLPAHVWAVNKPCLKYTELRKRAQRLHPNHIYIYRFHLTFFHCLPMSLEDWDWYNNLDDPNPLVSLLLDQHLSLKNPSLSPSRAPEDSISATVAAPLPLGGIRKHTTFNLLHYRQINSINSDFNASLSPGSTCSSSSSMTSSSPGGHPPYQGNGRYYKVTTLSGVHYRPVPSSMDFYENDHISRLMIKTFNPDSMLLIHTMFALVAYYLRCNCFKMFAWFTSNQSVEQAKRLRKTLVRLSSKYYGLAIHELRMLIATEDFNVPTAVIVSSLLNKVSIYEYSDLNHSITFSKGMVSIFNDVLLNLSNAESNMNKFSKLRSSQDMACTTNYIVHASKTKHFPEYDPAVVTEFLETLDRFKQILLQLKNSRTGPLRSLIFHFNHLYNYTVEVANILQDHKTTEINEDPIKLYQLLRQWLIIIPSKVHNLENLCGDPIEITLMALFKCFSKILESLFPAVLFHFLQGFCGGVSLWIDSRNDRPFVNKFFQNLQTAFEVLQWDKFSLLTVIEPEWPKIDDDPFGDNVFETDPSKQDCKYQFTNDQISEIFMINRYCIRLSLFFQKRANILSILFGDQKISNEVPPDIIRSNINEIMIKKFNSTNINYYNYPHLPLVVKIAKTATTLNNLNTKFNEIYNFNKHHFQYFLSKDSDKVPVDLVKKGKMDPMLRIHIFNTTSIEINEQEEKIEPSFLPTKPYHLQAPMIHYNIVFEAPFGKSVVTALEDSYQKLFDGKHENVPVVFETHGISGLFINDIDPLVLATDSDLATLYNRATHDLVTNHQIYEVILNFYNSRNEVVAKDIKSKRSGSSGKAQKKPKTKEEECDNEIENFFDDLNDDYFDLK